MTLIVGTSHDEGAPLHELDSEDVAWPVLTAAEERDAMIAGVQAGLADVEAGRTMPLEDYKTQVLAMRHMRDARKPR